MSLSQSLQSIHTDCAGGGLRAMLPPLACGLLCVSLLTACETEPANIACVDSARLVQESTPGRSAVAHMAKAREILQGNLQAVIKKVESYPDKAQAQQIAVAAQATLQQQLEVQEAAVNQQIVGMLQRTLQDYRKSAKLDIILNKSTVYDSASKRDVTPDALALCEKTAIHLPALPAMVAEPALPPARALAAPAAPVAKAEVKTNNESQKQNRTSRKRDANRRDETQNRGQGR